MSSLNKLKKNAMNQMYKNMTPQQIKDAIQIALDTQRKELIKEFNERLATLEKKYNNGLDYTASSITELISVEFIYELANQFEFWDLEVNDEDDKYRKESARYRIRETYENAMKSIKVYTDIKLSKKAHKIYKDKKKRITQEFEIDWK